MAFSTGIGDRSGLRSPREEQSFATLGLTSPLRSSNFGPQAASSHAGDGRGQLHRRFTTNNIPTLNNPLSPIGQQRRQAAEPAEFTTAVRSGALSFLVSWPRVVLEVVHMSKSLGLRMPSLWVESAIFATNNTM